MKKWIAICVILFTQVVHSFACDICGCSVGGMYIGILPQFQNHFVGVRYHFRTFDSYHTVNNTPAVSYDQFHTVDVWGRFYPHKRVQLMAFVPINIFSKEENNKFTQSAGIGDIQILANYIAYQTPDTAITYWKHNLMAGGGLKAPTGDFNIYQNDTLINPNLQLGSGSWDFLLNAMYTIRYKKFGLNLEGNARFNTTNTHGFRFGHRFSGAMRFFFWTKYKSTSFVPQIGLIADYGIRDTEKGLMRLQSGGLTLSAQAGIDFYIKRFVIGGTYLLPAYQDLAGGDIKAKHRFMVNFSVLF